MFGLIAHCDWSLDPAKRWMSVATWMGDRWLLAVPEPVGETSTLFDRLKSRSKAPVFVGFDFPIGLPEAYGRLTGFHDFVSALAEFGRGRWARWYEVCGSAAEISLFRPFYPQRPGGTSRAHLAAGLGLDLEALLRRCERRTDLRPDACMLFWTLGGNQVGKAAITGWRELITPNLARLGLWPFHGALADLANTGAIVVAETYPGEVYGHLGIARRPMWSKKKQDDRRRVGEQLHRWINVREAECDAELRHLIDQGFGDKGTGEDRFDALVGLLGMIDVADGRRPDGAPRDCPVADWEGWILGQTEPV